MTRYVIQKEWALTYCEERHPVPLGRNPKHEHGESFARRFAIDSGAKGYMCEGEEHPYPIWVVFNKDDDREANVGAFDTYREAKQVRDEMNAKL